MTVRVAFEHNHHTPNDVSAYLEEAKRLMVENGLTPDAHDATLAQVVCLLASKHVKFEDVSPLGIIHERITR